MRELFHQAGAIPYAVIDGEMRVLLITSRDTGRWVIPKGNIPAGATPVDTALEEAYEEAGIKGRITTSRPLGCFTYFKRLKSGATKETSVEVFPLRVDKQLKHWPERKQRKLFWVTPRVACGLVDEPELAGLFLRIAEVVEPAADVTGGRATQRLPDPQSRRAGGQGRGSRPPVPSF